MQRAAHQLNRDKNSGDEGRHGFAGSVRIEDNTKKSDEWSIQKTPSTPPVDIMLPIFPFFISSDQEVPTHILDYRFPIPGTFIACVHQFPYGLNNLPGRFDVA